MSDVTVFHVDDIQIDDDGSHGLPSLINAGFAPSIPQGRGSGGNGGTTQNEYVTFF